jgi:hypothetical protein
MDLASGRFVEKENLLPTREALIQMSDPQRMVDLLRDDLALRLFAFQLGLIRDLDREATDRLAAHLGYRFDWSREDGLRAQAGNLLDRYSLQATQFVLDKARDVARRNGRELMIVLFDPYRVMPALRDGKPRFDQPVVDYLSREGFRSFDMNEVHLREFRRFGLPYDEYMKLYFIGHYNARGNHFFAYSIKDRIVEWLDPKPLPYRQVDAQSVDFRGYLPDSR